MPANKMKYRPDKLKELMIYIAEKSIEDPKFGATKLNKILFFSDFIAYGQYGKSITGAHYQRLERGPAPRELLPAQAELESAKDAIVFEQKRFNFTQKRLLPLRDPDLSLFSAAEIATVDRVVESLRGHDAAAVSALSHELAVGWAISDGGSDIPYESVFISREPLTPTDVRRGRALAEKHGWLAAV